MNRTIAICLLICLSLAVVVVSLMAPAVLSDQNAFLHGFVNHELLSFLGVLVTVTLASASSLHLSLNELEVRAAEFGMAPNGFPATRASIRSTITGMVALLLLGVCLVVAKPVISARLAGSQVTEAFFNGFALLVMVACILGMVDISRAVLKVPALKRPATDR